MRSPLILSLFFLTGGAAAVAIGAGCSNASTFADGEPGTTPSAAGFGNDTVVSSDGGLSAIARTVSRLCSAAATCLPDDDGTFTPSSFEQCGPRILDAGTELAVHGDGCRIPDGGVTWECIPEGTDRSGIDGTTCTAGSDCAPGFDCVLGTGNRSSVCRRYCCAGSSACDDHMSKNGGKTFCDIQTLAESSILVPVCMPIKQCTLLKAKECTSAETCAIVTDKGDTGCVATGPQKEGDACDEAHCADGLTCLGSAGGRKCYKLCRVDDTGAVPTGCADTQRCTTGSLFTDTTYGVCSPR